MRPFGQYTRAAIVLGVLGASGALSAAASPRWSYDDIDALAASRFYVTAHVGDTIVNRLTISTDTVALALPRPGGVPSRIWTLRCGRTTIYSRHWIGGRIISAETLYVNVQGTTAECAATPSITQEMLQRLQTVNNACDSLLIMLKFDGSKSVDPFALPPECRR